MAVFDALLLAKTKASVLSICLPLLTDLPFFSSLIYVLKTLFHFNLFPDILPMPTVQRASGVIFYYISLELPLPSSPQKSAWDITF